MVFTKSFLINIIAVNESKTWMRVKTETELLELMKQTDLKWYVIEKNKQAEKFYTEVELSLVKKPEYFGYLEVKSKEGEFLISNSCVIAPILMDGE